VSRVLVSGASGFIGTPLVHRLIADGEEVHAVSGRGRETSAGNGVRWHQADLLDPSSVERLVEEVQADRLVHLAWYVAHGRFWSAPENAEWVEASLRLLRAFVRAGGRRALLVGTCAEYQWAGTQDLDEYSSALEPRGLYGACKDGLRRIGSAYAEEVGLELAWGRLFFLYGPGEQPERLVPAVIRSLLSGRRVATTAGTQVRDFMHVDDAARALATVLQSALTGPVNIATGAGTSVTEILDIIGAATGAADLIDRGARPTPRDEPPRIVANVERLTREAGFQPAVSLSDGLAASVDWWRRQPAQTVTGS
jgi:nucleoside-diphosphate-sugar epimerase